MTTGALKTSSSFKISLGSSHAVSPRKSRNEAETEKTSQNFDDIYFLSSPALFFRFNYTASEKSAFILMPLCLQINRNFIRVELFLFSDVGN
jgi:hypothetical protein